MAHTDTRPVGSHEQQEIMEGDSTIVRGEQIKGQLESLSVQQQCH